MSIVSIYCTLLLVYGGVADETLFQQCEIQFTNMTREFWDGWVN